MRWLRLGHGFSVMLRVVRKQPRVPRANAAESRHCPCFAILPGVDRHIGDDRFLGTHPSQELSAVSIAVTSEAVQVGVETSGSWE